METQFPASLNAYNSGNRKIREVFFQMKDFGYDNYDKNYPVIMKFSAQGKIDNLPEIVQELDQVYNPIPLQPQPQPIPVAAQGKGQNNFGDLNKEEDVKAIYLETLRLKNPNEPWKTVMRQLCEFGYTDFDKNEAILMKHQHPKLEEILDELNKQH